MNDLTTGSLARHLGERRNLNAVPEKVRTAAQAHVRRLAGAPTATSAGSSSRTSSRASSA